MTADNVLLLRVDGGPAIGGGHVMRCLALAQTWGEEGDRAAFAVAQLSPSLRQRLAADGFECISIDAEPGSPDDATATVAAANHLGAAVAVVDGYQFEVSFHERLRDAGLKIAALDDNGEIGRYVDDLVINQNRHATPDLYPERAPQTRLLLGTGYALLRREFRVWRGEARMFAASVRQVLVTLGAADPRKVTAEVIAAIAPTLPAGTELLVVVGGSNPHGREIAACAAPLANCRLLSDPGPAMPDLMAATDLAVCAGGSTMWEMAFMGVPFVPIVIAENQRQAVAAMVGDGYPAVNAPAVGRDLPAIMSVLGADAGRRAALSRRGRELVDGQGAARVCAALRALVT